MHVRLPWRRQKFVAAAAGMVLAMSLAACSDSPEDVSDAGLARLRVGVFPGVLDYTLESMAADERFNFFEKNGLDVELV